MSNLIIGTIVFSNWLSYADNTVNDIFGSLDVDASVIADLNAELISTVKDNIRYTIVISAVATLIAIAIYYAITGYLL
ncbi:MAG: hypothetical protein GX815_08720 [Clostridiales bacterium]|nr:hypothetical protein [Clostridiales bacterium]